MGTNPMDTSLTINVDATAFIHIVCEIWRSRVYSMQSDGTPHLQWYSNGSPSRPPPP